jgi:hypothetical protein
VTVNPYPYPATNCEKYADGSIVPRKPTTTPTTVQSENLGVAELPDGASNTILAGERWFDPKGSSNDPTEDNGFAAGYTWDTIRWGYSPISNDYSTLATSGVTTDDYAKFGAPHRTVCHFVFCDGSTKPISYTIDHLLVFRKICSRNDGTPQTDAGIGTN